MAHTGAIPMRFCRSFFAVLLLSVVVAGCGGGGGGGGGFTSAASTASTSSTTTPATTTTATTTTSTTAIVGTQVIARGTIRALTYNVAGLPQGLSSSSPVTNQPQMSPMLNTYDLVLVQEDFAYHNLLSAKVTHPYQTPPLTSFATVVGDGLNAFSRIPLSGLLRTRWLDCNGFFDQANDCLSSKGFFFCQIEVRPGVKIDVYDLHADAGRSSGDCGAREKQFKQLADAIRSLSNGHAVLVAGDTNLKMPKEPRDEATMQLFMKAANVQDVGRTLNQPEHLDRFFWRGTADLEIQPLTWKVATEFVDAAGNDLSDHEAINVDFEWRQIR